MKKESRILGLDDASFDKTTGKNVLVIGTIFRGGTAMDGVMSTKVRIDGRNATSKLIKMINESKWHPQIRCIMIDGIALGGFNIIDIQAISIKTGIPVIAVMRQYPRLKQMKEALIKLNMKPKIKLLEKAGPIIRLSIHNLHVQLAGINQENASEFIKLSTTHSNIPEPLRAAHLIGQGIILGESRGKA
jgi:uncharacterized protein